MSLPPSYMAGQAILPSSTRSSHDTQSVKAAVPSPAMSSLPRPSPGSSSTKWSSDKPPLSLASIREISMAADAPKQSINTQNGKGDLVYHSSLPRAPNSSQSTFNALRPPSPRVMPFVGCRLPISHQASYESTIRWDSTHRVLRRKAPFVQQSVSRPTRPTTSRKLSAESQDDYSAQTSSKPLPIGTRDSAFDAPCASTPSDHMPSKVPPYVAPGESPPVLIPELKSLAPAIGPGPMASSTPHLPLASSPSTQYSGSVGPWSSRGTTPTSVSSCSPGLTQFSKNNPAKHVLRTEPTYTSAHFRERSFRHPQEEVEVPTSMAVSKTCLENDVDLPGDWQSRVLEKSNPQNPSTRVNSMLLPRHQQGLDDGKVCSETSPKTLDSAKPQNSRLPVRTLSWKDSNGREPPSRPRRDGSLDLDLGACATVQSSISPQSLDNVSRRQHSPHANPQISTLRTERGTSEDVGNKESPCLDVGRLPESLGQEQVVSTTKLSKHSIRSSPKISPQRLFPTAQIAYGQKTNERDRSTLKKLSAQLGVFVRRSKVSQEGIATAEDFDGQKCPTAGTGHEGYGKYARRGRKFSQGSANGSRSRSTSSSRSRLWPSFGRCSSQSSRADSDVDDFVAQRLRPVAIKGRGCRDIDFRGVGASTTQTSPPRPLVGSDQSLPLKWQVANERAEAPVNRLQSTSAASVATMDVPSTIAKHTKSISPYKAATQVYPVPSPPSLDGYSTSQSSLAQEDSPGSSAGHDIKRATFEELKKAGRRGGVFRWNVFQRGLRSEDSVEDVHADPESGQMSVVVDSKATERPVPYYALVDSEDEVGGESNLPDLLDQVQVPLSSEIEPQSEPRRVGLGQRNAQSALPADPVLLQPEDQTNPVSTAPNLLEQEEELTEAPPASHQQSTEHKTGRLPHVGRIPQVISRRDRQHTPPAASFSRPFQRGDRMDLPKRSGPSSTSLEEPERPSFGLQTRISSNQPFTNSDWSQSKGALIEQLGPQLCEASHPVPDTAGLPSQEGRRITARTSLLQLPKLAIDSVNAPLNLNSQQDEIWGEYDDLMDEVVPSNYRTNTSTRDTRPDSHLRLATTYQVRHQGYPGKASTLPSPSASSAMWSRRDHGGRDHGRHCGGANAVKGDTTLPSAGMPRSTMATLPEASRYQSTALLDVAERDYESPAGQSDLRFAALMTSRWLSFGRVLFSPAHEVIEKKSNQHVLVIDGLGNNDWSFYCAINYPNAVVHAITETEVRERGQEEMLNDSKQAPSNHRRVEVSDLASRFPFSASYFAAIVFRFPASMPDGMLKSALSECKRVLAPGGYLELSLLDLDIVNMGTHTRRAVRDLKARMISADPKVSLKPVSDNVQSILGQRGFENLNRCTVSVPVDGKTAPSPASRSCRSSRGSWRQPRDPKNADVMCGGVSSRSSDSDPDGCPSRASNFALSELVSDHSATSDEKITKMVAKVGRWWYTRTYEWAVLPGGNLRNTIWNNKRMLRECKIRGSGFKLLIAYAQNPSEPRRRTMSEPIQPTMAASDPQTTSWKDTDQKIR